MPRESVGSRGGPPAAGDRAEQAVAGGQGLPVGQVHGSRRIIPRADHHPGRAQPARGDRLHREIRVVQSSQARAAHHHQSARPAFSGDIGQGVPAQIHEDPAGALHQDDVVPLAQAQDPRGLLRGGGCGRSRGLGGGRRGQRQAQGEARGVGDPGQLPGDLRIPAHHHVRVPRLQGLPLGIIRGDQTGLGRLVDVHVQTLTGASQQVRQAQQRAAGQAEANRYSVALELQADCYAGVWAANAAAVSNGQVALEAGDLQEGMRTAQAIGDDTLQRRGGGRVSPESFTHGSSAQRVEWLQRGYQAAADDPDAAARDLAGRGIRYLVVALPADEVLAVASLAPEHTVVAGLGELPLRDAAGEVDPAGAMQAMTRVVEGWVREHPEQWLWMHRRWR